MTHLLRRLTEFTSRQQQTQRMLLDWPQMEYAIEMPSNKLLAPAELDSESWVGEVKRPRGKKLPLTARPSVFLLSQFQLFSTPARAPSPPKT
jgi:hypothetical protein